MFLERTANLPPPSWVLPRLVPDAGRLFIVAAPRPPPALQESVSTLRDVAKDLVLDAARLWREQKGAA